MPKEPGTSKLSTLRMKAKGKRKRGGRQYFSLSPFAFSLPQRLEGMNCYSEVAVTPFLFVTDLDNTLVGDDAALAQLNRQLSQHRQLYGRKIVNEPGDRFLSIAN